MYALILLNCVLEQNKKTKYKNVSLKNGRIHVDEIARLRPVVFTVVPRICNQSHVSSDI